MISKLIADLLSCPTHLRSILAPKKVVEKEKSKKKLPSCMYDDFHAHLVWTNSKTKESNMNQKLKEFHPYIYTEETYMLYKDSKIRLIKFFKDINSSTDWRRLCSFAFIFSEFSKHAKDSESSENHLDLFQHQLVCTHSSTILLETLELTSCDFLPSMNKCLFEKRLAKACTIPVDDVPNVVLAFFSPIFQTS